MTETRTRAAGKRGNEADDGRLMLEVAHIEKAAPDVRTFHLRHPDGELLPSFTPGSYVMVDCGENRNAYSLTEAGTLPEEYRISVLRVPDGNGGSAWLHDHVAVGDSLPISRPRSAFPPVSTALHHLLIAGGIGITPMLSHAHAAIQWTRSMRLLYVHRQGSGSHVDELRALCGRSMEEFTDREGFTERLVFLLGTQPLGTHVYVCGPDGLVDLVQGTARDKGWPEERVHVERFSAGTPEPGQPFTARLAASGRTVPVPAGVSLLSALEQAGLDVPNMCRQGVCGECRTHVRSGRPEHRDMYLSERERAVGDSVMCCVSRSLDEELELEL